MKEKCDDKEWMHCRVEKMGCDGCHYEDRQLTEIEDRKKKLLSEQVEIDPDAEMRKEELKFDYEQRHKGDD